MNRWLIGLLTLFIFLNQAQARECSDWFRGLKSSAPEFTIVEDEHYFAIKAGPLPSDANIVGQLDKNGILDFQVRSRDALGKIIHSKFISKYAFKAMMKHFGPRVKAVRDSWYDQEGMRDNLDSFNQGLRHKLTKREAALATWTGRMCCLYGFCQVKSLKGSKYPGGDFSYAEVIFTR